jgi:hypothetical protein
MRIVRVRINCRAPLAFTMICFRSAPTPPPTLPAPSPAHPQAVEGIARAADACARSARTNRLESPQARPPALAALGCIAIRTASSTAKSASGKTLR